MAGRWNGLSRPGAVPRRRGIQPRHPPRPTAPGNGYTFTVAWARSFQPTGNGDSTALGPSMTSINLTMNVVGNVAPRLVLPASFSVEGNTANGWTAVWSGVLGDRP